MAIKVTGLDKLKRTMKRVEANMPEIKAQTLNNMAWETRALTGGSGGTIARNFHIRNKFTQAAVIVSQASRRPGSVAIVGAVNIGRSNDGVGPGDYLAVQEFGDSSHVVGHIPTDDARIAKSPSKRTSARKHLSKANFSDEKTGGLVTGNRQAMWLIKKRLRTPGGKKRPLRLKIRGKHGVQEGLYKLDGPRSKPLRMIQNVSKKKVKIKKKPWLLPAALVSSKRGQRFFIRNFNRHLRKL